MAKPTVAELQLVVKMAGLYNLPKLTEALKRVAGTEIRRQLDAQAKALLGIEDAMKKVGRVGGGGGFGNFLKFASRGTIVAQGLYRGFKMVGGAIADAVEPMAEFQFNMARVRAKGNLTAAEAKAASDAVKAMTGQTQFSPIEASTAAVGLAAAGQGKNLAAVLPTSLRFAQANDIDPEKASEILLGTGGQFGMRDPKGLERIGNLITKADQMSVLSVSQIYDTLKYVGPLAKNAKMPLASVLSMIVSLGDQGIVGSKAGTGARNLLSAIAAPPRRAKQAQKLLDTIGLKQSDLQAGFGDIPKFLKDLRARFMKYNIKPAQVMAINKTLFGQYGMTSSAALMADSRVTENGRTAIQNYQDELNGVGDLMKDQADLMGGTFKNKLAQINAEWELMKINIGEMDVPKLSEAVNTLLKFMRGAEGQNVAKQVADLTAAAVTLAPAVVSAGSGLLTTVMDGVTDTAKAYAPMGTFGADFKEKDVPDDVDQENFLREQARQRVLDEQGWFGGIWSEEQLRAPDVAGQAAVDAYRLAEKKRRHAEFLSSLTPQQREDYKRHEQNRQLGLTEGVLAPHDAPAPPPEPVKPHEPGELYIMVNMGDDLKASVERLKQGSGPLLNVSNTSQ